MSAFAFDVTAADFEQKVVDASRKTPVLVDFWAAWCAPCRTLKPMLEKLADEFGGRILVAKVNTEQEQELAARFGIRGIPDVRAFVGGTQIDGFTGALPENALREFIARILPSDAEPLRLEAQSSRERGDVNTSRALLLKAIDADPKFEAARLDLIDLLIDINELDEADRLLKEIIYRARDEERVRTLEARLGLASARPASADEAALRARIDDNGADLEARLELANLAAEKGEFDTALENLLAIVQQDRGFKDDAGRKTMIQVFSLMPSDSPLLRDYRSRLAAVLNR
ncbi:tetratricopeptide repeat protein [Cognatazoarcus halotolerans]|uniref:tetratricopeptide repeat protein n=1 Tax=Cognatazoarcus halotolerans TaxID=2686016 RepID=UPI00135C21B6|nr:tetratricopeptide repeat protein [Cognatazoarcus halotolerans]MCB1898915.1 tetratricopeptide repeat protein [Rhodocyclaceae bacterium]MCP5309134.1 tetratricopeptide repeat protein [Zoogloeaceae bacterium]